MAEAAYSVPSFASLRAGVASHKTAMSVLAVIFACTFSSMVTSSYCANHINKSACGKTDEDAKRAHYWATVSAVLGGLVSLGSVVGIVYILYRK